MDISSILKYIKYALTIILIFILITSLISAYMFISENIQSKTPLIYVTNYNSSFSNGSLIVTFNLHVLNPGFYPLENSKLSYTVFNNTTLISSGNIFLGDISGNYSHYVKITIIPSSIILEFLGKYMTEIGKLFNFQMDVSFSTYYTFNLYHFVVNIFKNLSIEAPIMYFHIGYVHYIYNSSYLNVSFPFTIDTANYLKGNMTLETILSISSANISYDNVSVPLGLNFSNYLVYHIPSRYLQNNEIANSSIFVWLDFYGYRIYLGEFK